MKDQLIEAMDTYQNEVRIWNVKNFGCNKNGLGALAPMMGIVEEVGELYHARLKLMQGIRQTGRSETGDALGEEEVDALGDLMVFMFDYCARRNLSLATCFLTAWEVVRERDWVKYPQTGVPVYPAKDDR